MTAQETNAFAQIKREYAPHDERPLGSFLTLMGVYGATVATGVGLLRRRGARLPERPAVEDLLLMSVATHRLSRLLAKDPITSPLRAPFTRFEGTSGPAELKEEVRGRGIRKAVGELVTCPFCLAQWVATSFAFGMVAAPRFTRMTAAVFSTVAAADFLHLLYHQMEPDSHEGDS